MGPKKPPQVTMIFFVVEPSSYSQGYIAWDDDGNLVDEHMAVAGSQPILISELPDLPRGVSWAPQVSFALKCIEGQNEGTQLLYKVSSRGGKAAIADLLAKIIARAKTGVADIYPVLGLDSTYYQHKKYGRIYTPILTLEEWTDVAEEDEPLTGEQEPEPEPEPAPKKRARRAKAEPAAEETKAEEVAEGDPAATEPPRRRRRA